MGSATEVRGTAEGEVSPSARRSLAEKLWGIAWEDHFPIALSSDTRAETSNYEEVFDFIGKHGMRSYDESPNRPWPLVEEDGPARRRYYAEVGDFFVFRRERENVGIFLGAALDWSSYYLRSCIVTPEFQGRSFLSSFLPPLFALLSKHGVERVLTDVSPSNLANIHILTRQGFNIAGFGISERWGGLVQMVRYLRGSHESAFLERFCFGVQYQRRARKRLSKDKEGREEDS